MKTELWCVGKTEDSYIKEGMGVYQKRLGNYLTFGCKEIIVATKNTTAELQKEAEKNAIIKLLKPTDFLILLDEKGSTPSSKGFADFLQKKFNSLSGNMIFLVGGAYGFHDEIYERAQAKIALSEMTFTHQMVRLIFLEQLYRAMTILRNEPYHH
ncbi:MAG: 23S rRNA (pseudouridine(1915)-N(3))-methyltransferase RlmH [Bacteroidetes bacterium]|nr:23S rRNA (pseudouridine(1915)-N(3))-methyltransferase RlmH [Bacteroidota bacterium]